MRAVQLCQDILRKSLLSIHATRLAALWFATDCLMRGNRLTLTALGRAGRGHGKEKHCIKKIDRLLGNQHLVRERTVIWNAIALLLLAKLSRPLLVIDWTPWREGFHSLTVGLAVGGRCLIFYGEVHPEKKLNNPKVHRRFLDRLADMLPEGSVPILITDAGFRTSWLDDVERRQWDFVARVRGRVRWHDPATDQWIPLKKLFERADGKPRSLGMIRITQAAPRERRVVVIHKRGKPRRKKRVVRRLPWAEKRKGHVHNMSSSNDYYRKVAQEPWVLLTSFTQVSAKEIVRLYSLRMQTEETYRGMKSHKYGWSFEDALSSTVERLSVLLLIGALASLAASLVGWIVEQRGGQRDYQANTERRRRVLSWFYLGIRVILRGDQEISVGDLRMGLLQICMNGDARGLAP